MNPEKDQCVLFFVKAPVAGQVKTRLAAEIGAERAAELCRCFGLDLASRLDALGAAWVCCFHPPGAESLCAGWLGEHRRFWPQQGDDLGQRMANAFRRAFDEGFSRVLVIGSDIPDVPLDFVRRAFVELQIHSAVIGPSTDGGYYLMGFDEQHFLPEVFEDIEWSTDTVFERSLQILQQHGCGVFILPRWHDVDTHADLEALIQRGVGTAFENSQTFAFTRQCEWCTDKGDNR
jgi:rSAM/selenodomain-associated transferase 1